MILALLCTVVQGAASATTARSYWTAAPLPATKPEPSVAAFGAETRNTF